MNQTTINMQAHKSNNPLLNAIALVFVALVIFCMASCKKQVGTDEKIELADAFLRVSNLDIDGAASYSKIIRTSLPELATEGTGPKKYTGSQPLDWNSWTNEYRIKWCNELVFLYDYFPNWFCAICRESAPCASTPVEWGNIWIDGNTLKFEILTEVNVEKYQIHYSKDGKTYRVIGELKPKGVGLYTYNIKK